MTTNINQAMQSTIKATELWDAYIYLKGLARRGDTGARQHAETKRELADAAMDEADDLLEAALGEEMYIHTSPTRDGLVSVCAGFEPGHLEKLANLRAEAVAMVAAQAPQLLPLVMANLQMHIIANQAHVRTY